MSLPAWKRARLSLGGALGPLAPGMPQPLASQIERDEKAGYTPHADHVYFDVSVPGNKSTVAPFNTPSVLAKYDETFQLPLLSRCDDYRLIITRFKLPTAYIPLFNYDGLSVVSIQVGAGSPAINTNNGIFSSTVTIASPADPTQPTMVWYVRDFVVAVNAAIRTAYNAAVTAGFGGSPGLPPHLSYDGSTGLFSIQYEQTWWSPEADTGVNAGATAKLFFNAPLFETFFDSFRGNYSSGVYPANLDVQVLLQPTGPLPGIAGPQIVCQTGGLTSNGANPSVCTWSNAPVQHGLSVNGAGMNQVVTISGASPAGFNGNFLVTSVTNANTFTYTAAGVVAAGAATGSPTMVAQPRGSQIPGQYNTCTQETPSVASWDQFVNLRFVTNSVPVRQEWVPSSTSGSGASLAGTRLIMTDFDPSFSDQIDTRNYIQYFPTGEFRRIDLVSTEALRRFDVQAFWVDRLQNENPIYVPNDDVFTLKVLFESRHQS